MEEIPTEAELKSYHESLKKVNPIFAIEVELGKLLLKPRSLFTTADFAKFSELERKINNYHNGNLSPDLEAHAE